MIALIMGSAEAGTLSTQEILNQFSAVVFGSFSSTADVEGRIVVGANLTGGASFNTKRGGSASSFSAITVYGSATSFGNYNVNSGGGVTIAGGNNASFNLNDGGAVYVGGANSGKLSVSNGSGSLNVMGANSGTLQLGSGGSVYLGGTSGNLSAGGNATVAIKGDSTANINLNQGGTVALAGSNFGTISMAGGSISFTGNQSGNLNLNNGATATKVTTLNLNAPTSTLGSFATTFQTPLTNLSTQLNNVAANSTATTSNNSVIFNATPDTSGVAVFGINTSLFAPNSTVTINLNNATSVIVNVNVDSCVSSNCSFSLPNSVNFANPTGYAATVLWNFVNATNLTFPNEFGGSVLAPLAGVTNNAPIDGTLVAASYAGNGELHLRPYTGTLPGTVTLQSSARAVAAPEPGTAALIGTGLAGLAGLRRRKGPRHVAIASRGHSAISQ
jgi:choice-of-anchor A domain-containing protein